MITRYGKKNGTNVSKFPSLWTFLRVFAKHVEITSATVCIFNETNQPKFQLSGILPGIRNLKININHVVWKNGLIYGNKDPCVARLSEAIEGKYYVGSCFLQGRISTTCVVSVWKYDRKCKYTLCFYIISNGWNISLFLYTTCYPSEGSCNIQITV